MVDSTQENNIENNLPAPDGTNDSDTNVNTAPSPLQTPLNEQPQKQAVKDDNLDDDKEFFEALEASINKASSKSHRSHYNDDKISSKRLLRIEIILLIGSATAVASLIYSFYRTRLITQIQMPEELVQQLQPPAAGQSGDSDTSQEKSAKPEQAELTPSLYEEPISLKFANDSFMHDDFHGAFQAYARLNRTLPKDPNQQPMHSFLKLRMAICLKKVNRIEQADKLLRILSVDDSCPLAAMANYQRALIEFERNQYLQARACAYRAMALCEAVTADAEWAVNLKKDCHFLISLSLTNRIVGLSGIDVDMPARLWRINQHSDFGCDKEEALLDEFLKSGDAKLKQALIGPKVKKLDVVDSVGHFEVISNNAPAEELFARFTSSAKLFLVWAPHKSWGELRRQPVSLFLPDVTSEEFASIAAGCVGLQAAVDSQTTPPSLIITNPSEYTDLPEYLSSIADEALKRWSEFIIKYNEDGRLPNAHFACGIIYQVLDQTIEAVAQYKTVANRYAQSPSAPYALLHSSKIKADLHDYAGAKQDLKQLVEQYHRTAIAQAACLYLADAAFKTELYDEAANTYCRVYNLDDSLQSRAAASLGAARAFFALDDYTSAQTWVERYINLVGTPSDTQQENPELYSAYLLLGRVQLLQGKLTEAFNAFKLALNEDLTQKDRSGIITTILQCDLESLDPIEALDLLETLQSQGLSPQESTEAILTKCRILRKIHLPQKALDILNDRFDYILQPQLRAKAYFEVGQCYIELGQPEKAHLCFVKLLAIAEPCPLADQATLKLAELSLQLDKPDKAIELCSQLLARQIPVDLRQAAVHVMALAYKKQNNLEKAVSLLLEQADQSQDTTGDKTASGNSQTQKPSENITSQDS
jgi:tetratricopeptide (TPR) repeat protein